ncbi:MAG TPA: Hsp20/alpha crystallin family protein [Balneolales bacterium]|nr:Hsp20/alpha crystallin family protein [Balneolales bacterium]
MSDLHIDFERHLSNFGNEIQNFIDRLAPEEISEGFRPRTDIVESSEEFKLFFDVPGMSKDEIYIGLKDNVLTIKGERVIDIAEGESLKKQERKRGMFSRSIALPDDVNTAEIKAKLLKGVLSVTLPKSDVLKDSTSIQID